MTRSSTVLAGLWLLLSGCAVDTSDDSAAPALAGSAGSDSPSGTAGATSVAGADTGGGDMGGADASGGQMAIAGSAGESTAGSGGSDAEGGAGGSAGKGAGGGSGGLDYSIWQLQLPTGSGNKPDSVAPKDLATFGPNAYFFLAADGGRVFMDPKFGITTIGSMHPRSEMRESNLDGSEAEWTSKGTNTLTVVGKGIMLSGGTKGSATVAQVFVGTDNTLAELQYNGSSMSLFYEEAKSGGGSVPLPNSSVPLNTKYKFVLGYSKNVLTVTLNDKLVYTRTPSSAVSGKTFHFKVGNYDQIATAGTPNTTPYTQIEVYSVNVLHQ